MVCEHPGCKNVPCQFGQVTRYPFHRHTCSITGYPAEKAIQSDEALGGEMQMRAAYQIGTNAFEHCLVHLIPATIQNDVPGTCIPPGYAMITLYFADVQPCDQHLACAPLLGSKHAAIHPACYGDMHGYAIYGGLDSLYKLPIKMLGKCNAQHQNMRQSTGLRGSCNKPGRVFVFADYSTLATFEIAPPPNTASLS